MKAIIFDLQGTLLENGVFPSPVKQVRFILNIQARFHEYITEFERIFMTKQHKSLNEAFAEVAEAFGVELTPAASERLVGMWNKNKLLSRPFPETMETLDRLHSKYRLILVANVDNFTKDVIEKFSLQKHFDHIFLSCDTGKLKNDEGFYDTVLKEAGFEKDEVLLVGDSVESDMKAAEAAGIDHVLVDRNDRMNYDDKILSLEEIE